MRLFLMAIVSSSLGCNTSIHGVEGGSDSPDAGQARADASGTSPSDATDAEPVRFAGPCEIMVTDLASGSLLRRDTRSYDSEGLLQGRSIDENGDGTIDIVETRVSDDQGRLRLLEQIDPMAAPGSLLRVERHEYSPRTGFRSARDIAVNVPADSPANFSTRLEFENDVDGNALTISTYDVSSVAATRTLRTVQTRSFDALGKMTEERFDLGADGSIDLIDTRVFTGTVINSYERRDGRPGSAGDSSPITRQYTYTSDAAGNVLRVMLDRGTTDAPVDGSADWQQDFGYDCFDSTAD